MAAYMCNAVILGTFFGILVLTVSGNNWNYHHQKHKEYVEESSDLNHLAFEAEDGHFVEEIILESPLTIEELSDALKDDPVANDDDHGTAKQRVKRTAIYNNGNLWRSGMVPYMFSEPIKSSSHYQGAILEAMEHIQDVTCVRFKEKPKSFGRRNKLVNFVRGSSCHSSVGKNGGVGEQEVTLSRTCAYPEMVIHELGHLLGLWHEHARSDRDNNVLVLINNVSPNYGHNFEKVSPMRLMAPYDLSSMMHYEMTTFTANGDRTMTPLDSDLAFLVGQKNRFSFYDTYTLNKLYNCSEFCPEDSPVCINGGYLSKDCVCACPEGLTGSNCEHVITTASCGKGVIELGLTGKVNITSPGYPHNYPDNIECRWLVKSPPNTVMMVSVPDINIEQSSRGTCRDQLEIRYHHVGIAYGPVYCGTSLDRTFETTSNLLILRFSSNFMQTKRGFRAMVSVKSETDCSSNPCQNGGVCYDPPQIGTYWCDCPNNWVGHNCDQAILDGHWSEWSAWTKCIAPCGRQTRGRTCTNPAPSNGGTDCQGAHFETRKCGNQQLCQDAFSCDFGSTDSSDMCDLIQDKDTDKLDWQIHQGATPSQSTGPPSGHSTGQQNDNYLYLEASYGRAYDDAIVWLPDHEMRFGLHCFQFFYQMRGEAMGSLVVFKKISKRKAVVMWQYSGSHGSEWNEVNMNILFFSGMEVGIMAVRGDTYSSDIAVDDLSLSYGACGDEENPYYDSYGCKYHGRRKRVGQFRVTDGCIRMNCFCNQDGRVDCPEWQTESACEVLEVKTYPETKTKSWVPSRGRINPSSWRSKKQNSISDDYEDKLGLEREKWPYWLQRAAKKYKKGKTTTKRRNKFNEVMRIK